MSQPRNIVLVGHVGAAFGIKGWVHVHSYTEPPANVANYTPWYLSEAESTDANWREVNVLEARPHKQQLVARFDFAESRNIAETLRGYSLGVSRESLPDLEDFAYYWNDLIGLNVVNLQGTKIGVVEQCTTNGAHSLLEVEDGDLVRMVPFTRPILQTVDFSASTICVDWEPDWN